MREDHPRRPELAAWVDGELSESRSRELTDHVEGCSRCRDEVRSLERLSAVLGDLPERARPPEDARVEVEAAVGAREETDDGEDRGWRRWAAGLSAAAAAAAVLWAYVGSGGGTGPAPGEQRDAVDPAAADAPALETLDRAMADIRAALRQRPGDPYLRSYLARTRRLRADLEQEIQLGRGTRSVRVEHPGTGARR